MDIIPKKIRQQADESITHIYQFSKYPLSEEEVADYENYAKKVLEKYYNEAKLVITSRIHSAMPCIAMGIPVIFIHPKLKDSRLDVLDGIIPKYSPNDKYAINWNPKAPNIEKMKELQLSKGKWKVLLLQNYAEQNSDGQLKFMMKSLNQ